MRVITPFVAMPMSVALLAVGATALVQAEEPYGKPADTCLMCHQTEEERIGHTRHGVCIDKAAPWVTCHQGSSQVLPQRAGGRTKNAGVAAGRCQRASASPGQRRKYSDRRPVDPDAVTEITTRVARPLHGPARRLSC